MFRGIALISLRLTAYIMGVFAVYTEPPSNHYGIATLADFAFRYQAYLSALAKS
ncbi:hypothetical protein SDC9_186803 [bioreactor metagenome]|uniref:Uncharacterized protein n=1 Tax=bioreactor metagenome TaxID=1076179 RepID=A0A645HJT4_9ZZZZ